MDYWAETMQDDLYLIAQAGWIDAANPRLIVETKEKKSKEQPIHRREAEIQVGPDPCLIAGRPLFRRRAEAIEKLESEIAAIGQAMEEIAEEHSGEGGLLEDAKNDKDKLTKASVAARLKEIFPGTPSPSLAERETQPSRSSALPGALPMNMPTSARCSASISPSSKKKRRPPRS